MEVALAVISLMTDFGLKDGNVGVMKAVIWTIEPDVHIVDLSHNITPQNVQEAALILARSAPYFEDGTIHVVVVDPGVGTSRRPLAARLGYQYYVLPDNGLLTLVLEQAEKQNLPVQILHLDRPEFWRPQVSHVFHGRDIFAPVAGHLASGVLLEQLGTPISDPIRIAFPHPVRTPTGLQAEVVHIDHFGNISTSIRREDLGEPEQILVRLGKTEISGLVKTFGERPPGALVALYGSTDYLLVCKVNGDAASELEAHVGDPVEVHFKATSA